MLFKTKPKQEKWTRKAFEAEALPHMGALYGTALKMTRSPSDAQDLVQDTYFKALRAKEQFEPGSNCKHGSSVFSPTLSSTNTDDVSKNVKSYTEPISNYRMELLLPRWARAIIDPENALVDRFMSDEVQLALEALPVDYRTVITLSDVEGFSYKEVAAMVDIPVGTVMSRLHRGRRILQQKLFEYAKQEGVIRTDEGALSLEAYRAQKCAQ